MAVVAQGQITPEAPKSRRATRQPAAAWTTPSQLRKSLPIVRLLAEIWAVPQVDKIGVQVDGTGIYVRVLMNDNDREAESGIYAAERNYLNSTSLHGFDLRVIPGSRVPERIREGLLEGFQTVLER
jgi:hypothetical protein